MSSFEELIAEGEAVPTEGWDFSWFRGRASEERPPWGYARLVGQRAARIRAMLDVQTGGGEVLAGIPTAPPVLRATESWEPNLALAQQRLTPLGGEVVHVDEEAPLPFDDASFDLVVSRHPTVVLWHEIARVLRPGGRYLSQQVGAGSVHELSVAMLGEFEPSQGRSAARAVAAAEGAGLRVHDVKAARLRMEFHDIGAVVHFLRKVIWIVPDFSVEAFRPQLRALHDRIQIEGSFVAHATRFLIEAGC